MQVLVTGATGFIGRHVVRALVDAGHAARCLVRPTSDRSGLAEAGVTFAVGDVGAPDSLGAAVDGVDAVIHLASLLKAPWKRAFHTVNVEGTRNLAAACAAQAEPPLHLVVSSLAAGGPAPGGRPRVERDGAAPASIYGRVKRDAEQAAVDFAERVPTTIVRPPMVFGEGDTSVLKIYRSALRGLHVVPTLRMSRVSLVHAADLAQALVAALRTGERVTPGAPAGQGVYYVAADETPTYGELGRWIGEAVGRARVRVVRLPRGVTFAAAAMSEAVGRLKDTPRVLNLDKYREATAGDWICDAAKARAHLGFAPAPLTDRLAQTALWYRAQGWLPA